jgi:hypothetical protein
MIKVPVIRARHLGDGEYQITSVSQGITSPLPDYIRPGYTMSAGALVSLCREHGADLISA